MASPGTDGDSEEGLDLFRVTFEEAGVGLAHLTSDGSFLRVNQRYCDIVGYSREEMLALSPLDITHPDDQGPDFGDLARILSEEGGIQNREKRLVGKDGESTWVMETVYPVQGRAGSRWFFVSSIRDLSEEKRAERAIHESRNRLLRAESVGRVGFFELDLKTNEMSWSRKAYDLSGIHPRTPVTRETAEGVIHPDDREYVIQTLESTIQGVLDFRTDCRFVRTDGEVIWVHLRADLVRDGQGEPTFLLGTVVDITERKVAEEGRAESEQRFLDLMKHSPLAIELLTPDGRIVDVNAAWMRLWGVDQAETDLTLAKYNMRTDEQLEDAGVMPLVEKAFAGNPIVFPPFQFDANRTVTDFELEGVGEVKAPWVQCHLHPLRDVKGELTHIVNTYIDTTELKDAERDAGEQRDALARIGRAKSMGLLTGSIAHELNQPLTGILSNAQAAEMMIAAGPWEEEEIKEILGGIVSDTKRARDIIINLRSLYAHQDTEHEPLDLNAVVEAATKLLKSELDEQDVTLLKVYDPLAPMVEGNKVQLEQVVVNLILNGLQAMSHLERADRRLRVKTAFPGREARAWVEDRGHGIDQDHLDGIFEPLATWRPGGTGMGLAISNSIIEAHGGQMWAENGPEVGARVGFNIPVKGAGRET
jgi:PAS domain S-box-containing protein